MISGRPRLMGRLWNSWSILHAFTLFFLCLHHSTGCYARMWRMMSEESEEVAEVVHLPSSFFQYRRQLQTGMYCVASSSDTTQLQTALDWACGSGTGQGNVDCSPLQVGGACYTPDTVVAHASYAFNAYYVSQNAATGSCSFNGLATTTTTNPSTGTCVYQAYTGSNVSGTPPGTPGTPPGTPGTPPGSPPPPGTSTPTSNTTGTIFTPPTGDNTTIGSTNSAPPPSISLPWLYALCGGILLIALSSNNELDNARHSHW